jgi:hypothetical protein
MAQFSQHHDLAIIADASCPAHSVSPELRKGGRVMAEVLIWQSDGYLNSIATALFTAAQLKGLGVDVAVVFDEAAVAALAEKKFDPSPALAKYAATIFGNLNKMGMSPDPMDYLKQ